jgi:hypothetical protein
MIREMEDKHQWEFIFMGANQDAIHQAGMLGIGASRSLTFQANQQSSKEIFHDLDDALKLHLRGEKIEFSELHRKKHQKKK